MAGSTARAAGTPSRLRQKCKKKVLYACEGGTATAARAQKSRGTRARAPPAAVLLQAGGQSVCSIRKSD